MIDNLKEDKSVRLLNNEFEGNILTNSLISISQSNVLKYDENTPGSIIVGGNTFTASGSYYGTNALLITKYDTSDNPAIANQDNRCGKGIQIIANKFTQVVGTCQTDTGGLYLRS